MSQIFRLPDVGEGLTEAEILSWKVSVGDTVAVNDILVEIETAKSVVELSSPFDGVVETVHVNEGDTVEVETPIITISGSNDSDSADFNSVNSDSAVSDSAKPSVVEEAGEASGGAEPAEAPERTSGTQDSAEKTGDEPQALVGSGPKADPVKRRARKRPVAIAESPQNAPLPVQTAPVQQVSEQQERKLLRNSLGGITERASALIEGGLRRLPKENKDAVADGPVGSIPRPQALAKPPVRKAAKEMGVDLTQVTPTGESGQVTKRDLLNYVAHVRDEDQAEALPESFWIPQGSGGDRIERIKVRGVRKATAKAMVDSAFNAPHVSIFVDVDASRTMEFVKSLKKSRHFEGVKVTPLLILAKAVIWATARNPQVNATWTDQEILIKHFMNLGIAAATPRGLMVPNIKDAQDLSLRELAIALNELTVRAREGKTQPAEMQNGTMTVTNIGALGIDTGTPIINPGEVAIIAFGTIKQKPWVVDGEVIPRWVTTLGGSFDHRVVDGDLSARFMADVAAIMEEPALLLDE
ncbi:MAG: dihydrolipoamide acetyltransferase family protein [Rothia sp. (in: high G+C Gram-positive bacteria)]|nr:dihydrolipoamide acetyltransferase family protein [Rothia sp. (in: high G+C Gram-positive bacteria)]